MPGPTGDDDPPVFVGALRFRGPGVRGFAGTNELEIDGVGTGTTQGSILVSAGTTSALRSAFTLSNSNNVSFGINSAGVVTATASVASSLTAIRVSAGTTSNLLSALTLSNSNGLSFGLDGSTLTASHDGARSFRLSGFGNDSTFTALTETAISASLIHLPSHPFATRVSTANVYFRMSGSSIAAYAFMNFQNDLVARVSFENGGGVTFAGTTVNDAGQGRRMAIGASIATSLTAIRVSAGTTSNLLSAITFSGGATAFNTATPENVSFGLNGSTMTAIAPIRFSAGTTAFQHTLVSFQDAGNVSFGIDTNAGSIPRLTATATVAATRDIGIISHIGGNVVSSVSRLAFSNASNVTWSLSTAANAATIIASVAPGGGGGGIAASAAGSSQSAGTVVWSNSHNVSFGMNGSTITASVTVATSLTNIRISAGTEAILGSQVSFANSNGVSFGLNVSTITASYAEAMGLVSHIGGNSVADVTRLAFSNASNVTWSLSTAASAVTVLASVAAAGGGGIAMLDDGTTITSGSVRAHSGVDFSSLFSAGIGGNSTRNVQLGFAGTNLTGQAHMRAHHSTNGNGEAFTRINFLNSNGVTFGVQSNEAAAGERRVDVTASVAAGGSANLWRNFLNVTASQAININSASGSLFVSPLGFGEPFPANMTIRSLDLLVSGNGSTQTNSSYGVTFRGALYTLANSTQLSLVNSFSFSSSGQSTASANRNSSVNGIRWMVISSGHWSSAPVLSAGVNYWFALNQGSGGINVFTNVVFQTGPNMNVGANYAGTVGQASSTAMSSRFAPFVGHFATSTPPSTLGTAGLACGGAFSVASPMIQFRDGVFQ